MCLPQSLESKIRGLGTRELYRISKRANQKIARLSQQIIQERHDTEIDRELERKLIQKFKEKGWDDDPVWRRDDTR